MVLVIFVPRSQAQEVQAVKMRHRAAALDGGVELTPGAIVRLCLDPVDRAKLDNSSAVCVVVQKEKKSYRIANAGGVYKELVSRAHLQLVPHAGQHVSHGPGSCAPQLEGHAPHLRARHCPSGLGRRRPRCCAL